MKLLMAVTALLLFCGGALAQDEEEPYTVASCSLAVATTVYPAIAGDIAGKVMVEATLSDKAGSPIADQEIQMSATCGTFSCIAPESLGNTDVADRSCFITGHDGKVRVYLTSVPFNHPGRVKAACSYQGCSVKASGTFSITRNVIKKKAAKTSAVTP